MKSRQNPLLFEDPDFTPTADLERLKINTVHKRQVRKKKREIRDLRQIDNAKQAIDGWNKEFEIYGFSKSQFSLIDLITATLDIIGPAEMFISTWTAANTDVTRVLEFVNGGQIINARWLVDLTFQRRTPELAQRIRDVFGKDAIRVAKNHAKYVVLTNDDYKVVIQTSMNLNFNPRFENFSLAHDPELVNFLLGIANEIWRRQKRELASDKPGAIERFFYDEM